MRPSCATVNVFTAAVLALTCFSILASSDRMSLVALMSPGRRWYPLLRVVGLLFLPLSTSSSEESSRPTLASSAVLAEPLILSDVRKTCQHPTHLQCASSASRLAALPLRLSCSRSLRMDSYMSREQYRTRAPLMMSSSVRFPVVCMFLTAKL